MRITINLRTEEFEQPREMAYRERRTPRDQAAWLIVSELMRERHVASGVVPAFLEYACREDTPEAE